MVRFLPVATALTAVVVMAYAGHKLGSKYGHGTLGAVAGGLAGAYAGNKLASEVEHRAGLLGISPPVEGGRNASDASVINVQNVADRSKRMVADIAVNVPALVRASNQSGNTGPVTEAFTSEVMGGRAN